MDKSQLQFIPTASNPAIHTEPMTVDAVPLDLGIEPPDRLETRVAVDLSHAQRHVVSMALIDQKSIFINVRLAAAGCDGGDRSHPLYKDFKIAWRQAQIGVQLTEIFV